MTDNQVDLIKKNAQLVIEQLGPLSGIDFGLNRDSVEWVEGFIERQRAREDFDADNAGKLANVLGSFLGECIIANAGGEWQLSNPHGSAIAFEEVEGCAYPFTKVEKLFRNGLEGGDSILSFYDTAQLLAQGKLSAPAS